MSIHTLRKILELTPEVMGHIKQAKVNQEFPTDCKDSSLASALEIEYLTKIAGKYVEPNIYARVSKAVELYGLEDQVHQWSGSMMKAASTVDVDNTDAELRAAEAMFESNLAGTYDLEKVAYQAEQLYDNYSDSISSDLVKKYAGEFHMDKTAAINALNRRFNVTRKEEFTKLASIIDRVDPYTLSTSDLRKIASTVSRLDKSSGLPAGSFDFYKETMITKQAAASALMINLAGSKTPLESIVKLGKSNLAHILGSDVAAELGDLSDAQTVKAVLESLPLDLQKLLKKHCGC